MALRLSSFFSPSEGVLAPTANWGSASRPHERCVLQVSKGLIGRQIEFQPPWPLAKPFEIRK
jgi:hypothetical protein